MRSLGPIQWDFEKLQMKFAWRGKDVVLRGVTGSSQRVSDTILITKITRRQKRVIMHPYYARETYEE